MVLETPATSVAAGVTVHVLCWIGQIRLKMDAINQESICPNELQAI